MAFITPSPPQRVQLKRLLALWRCPGWPSHDAVELDLVAAGWAALKVDLAGHQTVHLTPVGVQVLAASRQRAKRCLSDHDSLAARMAVHLLNTGRLVWRELSLRARVGEGGGAYGRDDDGGGAGSCGVANGDNHMLGEGAVGGQLAIDGSFTAGSGTSPKEGAWRVARPDVFSVRRTSVEAYLHPIVHEIKISRADLLSDLRHAAKRQAYQWLASEVHYVLATGVAEPQEIPEEFGVWMLTGAISDGRLEHVRQARHVPCKLPFAVWMALAKAAPFQLSPVDETANSQGELYTSDIAAPDRTASDGV